MLRTLVVLSLFLVTAALPARAQTVSGTLTDGQAERPVVSGLVALTDLQGIVVDLAVTDDAGAFQLDATAPGDYLVVALAVGYQPGFDGVLELDEGGYIEIGFYLQPAPIELPGITATAERQRIDRYLDGQGFFDRQKMGFGYFITPEKLEERPPSDTKDLLRSVPGIDVLDQGYVGQSVQCSSLARSLGQAAPSVFVDGIKVHFPELSRYGRMIDLDAVVGMENLAAVEIYSRPSQVPVQYASAFDNRACVILIWTKH